MVEDPTEKIPELLGEPEMPKYYDTYWSFLKEKEVQ